MKTKRTVPILSLLALAFFVFPVPPARAYNVATDLSTTCDTAAAFQDYAMGHIPPGAEFWTSAGERMQVEFFLFNPDESLASILTAHGPCLATVDGGPCTWHIMWDDLTGTTTEEQSAFSELAPSMSVQIPSSVADTFTGTSQEAAVSAWLETNLASADPPLDFVIMTIFPDESSAEYQVTASDPLTFSLVAGSGHAGNGEPENDSGEPVAASNVDLLTSPASFNILEQIQATIAQERKLVSNETGTLGDAGISSGTGNLSSGVLSELGSYATAFGGTTPPAGSTSFSVMDSAGLTYFQILCTGTLKSCSN